MIRRTFRLLPALLLALGVLTACGLVAPGTSFASTHQALEAGRPLCSECHEDEFMKGGLRTYQSFDHTAAFVKEHRFAANRDANTCAACHSQASCSECHSGKVMIPPNVRLGNRPDRDSPHREGYLSLHRIDAKIDPTGCFTCHGRANNDTCRACHR